MTPDPVASPRRRTALITGASSGIGEAFADVFAAEGFDLVLIARREDRLARVSERVRARYGSTADVIVADLSRREAPLEICARVAARGLTIDALVNNAGFGVPGIYTRSPWERHDAFMQVMIASVAEMTYRLLPGMVARRYGRVINVASLAGLVPAAAGHTLYAASKAFVIRFSESLASEVKASGVHVTALCPGFTRSEFHDRTGTRETVSRIPPWMWMDSSVVARQGYDAVMAGIPVYVNGRVNRTIAALVKYVPQKLVSFVGRRAAKLYRNAT